MERFKWHGATDPATGQPVHDGNEAIARGLVPCKRDTGCDAPRPELSRYDARVLEFFLDCSDADLWVRVGMDAMRTHLDRVQMKVEADARGIVLSEHFLDKLQILEAAVRQFDASQRDNSE
jgi:hypothetical protein